ncbi:hypothetical protein MAR_014700 [Mya arenaria]|uniref:Uncharacterized protein n=1 Tax=Mya arenaria TaxID=6604 RepID=A0ABY7FND6_MYAAR|nr:hypothetical protein MAR_014700 [Mya arenaria]
MYRECCHCKNKRLETNEDEDRKQVWVYFWQNRHEQRIIKDKTQNVQVTVKEKVHCTLSVLVDEMNEVLKSKYCRHVYNITHQHKQLNNLKDTLTDTECIVHIDFSENYACKMSIEVQGMHFGASRNQASLHTGVLYLKGRQPTSFCSIFNNTRHDPASIGAHLHPILQEIKILTQLNESAIAVKLFYITSDVITKIDEELSNVATIPVKGTMLIHQVICSSKSECIYVRDLSCFCNASKLCKCVIFRKVVLVKSNSNGQGVILGSAISSNSAIGGSSTSCIRTESADHTSTNDYEFSVEAVKKWVVGEYDGLPYPGIVQNVDHESVEVKVMHSIGKNRYCWPARDDIFKYDFHDVVTEFEGMESVTGRHMQLPFNVWDKVCKKLDL